MASRRLRSALAAVRVGFSGLPRRAATTAAAVIGVTLATIVLLAFLAMSSGFRRTVAGSPGEGIAIVTRAGADSETVSVLTREQVAALAAAPGIRRASDGQPVLSPESLVILNVREAGGDGTTPVALRGMTAAGMAARPNAAIAGGRLFRPGTNEIVAGQGLARLFAQFRLGARPRFGGVDWVVVGIAAAPGSVSESELWTDAATLHDVFKRGSNVQVVRAPLASPAALGALRGFLARDPRLSGAQADSERGFFARQSGRSNALVQYIGVPLSIMMALGALAGAANALTASVMARRGEIGTLRAIDYPRLSILTSVLAEAVAICLAGALLGLLLCALLVNGLTASAPGAGFTQIVFRLHLGIGAAVTTIVVALVIAFAGGLGPAIGAMRLKPALGGGGI